MPQKPVRGIYFATHFHNFYHDAPTEEVQRYVEDLGLWGYNNFMVCYDMRHFAGFDDPEAVAFRRHLRLIFRRAKGIGLDVALVDSVNDGYNNSPVALRAGDCRRGDWNPAQICPSKPEGMKYLFATWGELFDWCADLRPSCFVLWPYDSGGCGCAACQPWGSNGFMKASEAIAALARQKLPGVKIIMSTWYFDKDEWKALHKTFSKGKPFVDYILCENFRHADWGTATEVIFPACVMPGGLPMVGFPEISMWGKWPWGGFGSTVLPRRYETLWNEVKDRSIGGWPYSEGLFEDVQKALYSQFHWNDRPAAETLREYAAFEYSPAVVDEVMRVFAILERNHQQINLDDALAAYKTVQEVDAKLTPQARKAWRWRQLYLRTVLDSQREDPPRRAAVTELIEIYHAQHAYEAVRPPLDPPPK